MTPLLIILAGSAGISAATRVLKVGAVGEPVLGPANIVLLVCVASVADSVPVVVMGLPAIVNSDGRLNPTLVTALTLRVLPVTTMPAPSVSVVGVAGPPLTLPSTVRLGMAAILLAVKLVRRLPLRAGSIPPDVSCTRLSDWVPASNPTALP